MKDMIKSIGLVAVTVLIVGGFGFLWHNKQMDSAEKRWQDERHADEILLEQVKELAEGYGVKIEDKSNLQKAIEDLKTKFDKWFQRDNYILDAKMVKSKISEISELATIEYQYNNVALHYYAGDTIPNTNITIPFTGTTVAIAMDGKVKAGIDLSEVDITCDDEQKKVFVTMPESKILSNELDESSLKVRIDEQSIFNILSQEQHNELRQQIKDKGKEMAMKSDILEMSSNRAQQIIKEKIDSIQNGKGDYEVVFRTAK